MNVKTPGHNNDRKKDFRLNLKYIQRNPLNPALCIVAILLHLVSTSYLPYHICQL